MKPGSLITHAARLANASLFAAVLGAVGPAMPAMAGGVTAPTVVSVWPGLAPGETTAAPGKDSPATSNYGPINTRTDVTEPQLYIYQPPNADGTARPAVLVCPGGGYMLCTTDIEGAEIARWLNAMGYVAAILYYRVPNWQPQYQNRLRPLQDAQRSIAFLRHNAKKYGIDASHVGMIGFSAGGHLATHTAVSYKTLSYTPVDGADTESVRPDFVLLSYPAYLIDAQNKIEPEVTPVSGMPPFFLTESKDDSFYPNVPAYAAALDAAGVVEKHYVYNVAGHGYGIRPPATDDGNAWMGQAENWLAANAPATPHSSCAELPYAATTPAMDGAVDTVWASAAEYPLNNLSGTIPVGGKFSATWKGLWDNANLYLLVNVVDDTLVSATPPANGDVVEVYVDASDSKSTTYKSDDYQFVFGWGASAVAEYAAGVQGAHTQGIRSATIRTSTGYTTEIAIPWKTLGNHPDNLVGIDIHVDDSNSATAQAHTVLMWNSAVDNVKHDPALAGTALLLPTPGVVLPTPPAAGPTVPPAGTSATAP